MNTNKNAKHEKVSDYAMLPLCLCLGVLVGIFTHNLALWIAIGVAIGSGASITRNKRKKS
jgi:hypothetical protein